MLATKSDDDGDNQTEGGDNDSILVKPLLHPPTNTEFQNSELEISFESAVWRIGLPKDIYNHIAWIIIRYRTWR